jgi:hypothetical protein
MNPFLVFAFIAAWFLFLLFSILDYLEGGQRGYCGPAFFFFIIAIFLTIGCGASWNNHHPDTQPTAIQQGK